MTSTQISDLEERYESVGLLKCQCMVVQTTDSNVNDCAPLLYAESFHSLQNVFCRIYPIALEFIKMNFSNSYTLSPSKNSRSWASYASSNNFLELYGIIWNYYSGSPGLKLIFCLLFVIVPFKTYVDEILVETLAQIVENASVVQVRQRWHVLALLEFGRIHLLDLFLLERLFL